MFPAIWILTLSGVVTGIIFAVEKPSVFGGTSATLEFANMLSSIIFSRAGVTDYVSWMIDLSAKGSVLCPISRKTSSKVATERP